MFWGLFFLASEAAEYDSWYDSKLGQQTYFVEGKNLLKLTRPKKGDLVLDVGCGTGRFSLLFKRRGCKVVGLDFSEEMLTFSKDRELTNIVRGDALHLPFHENSFRIVIAVTVLEFLKDPELALKEMVRVTCRGGKVVIGVLNKWSLWALRTKLRIGWRASKDYHPFTPSEIRKLVGKKVKGCVLFPPKYSPINLILENLLEKPPFRLFSAIIFAIYEK